SNLVKIRKDDDFSQVGGRWRPATIGFEGLRPPGTTRLALTWREAPDAPAAPLTPAGLRAPSALVWQSLQERPKTASGVGSGGGIGALGSTHHLHVAAGQAGATVSVRPEHVPTQRPEPLPSERLYCRACLVCRASSAGRGMAVARATGRLMLAVPLRP